MGLVLVMGIPVMLLSYENPRALYFVEIFIIFIVCMSLILFTFGPKLILQREVKRGNINMQTVVKEFAAQSQVYRSSRKKSRSSSIMDINSILAPISFRRNSANEKENSKKENHDDSHQVVQIEEGVDKKMKKKGRSSIEEDLTDINSSFEEGMEGH